jgi:hypothetical protein
MKLSAILAASLFAVSTVSALAQSATSSSATAATGNANGAAAGQAAAFRCGGVADEDQKRMKAEAGQHALMLTFASGDGAYLADVDVEIRRGGKVVVQGHCNGPIMLVDLAPAGSYEVVATAQGRTQHQTVSIGAKPASVTLHWPR